MNISGGVLFGNGFVIAMRETRRDPEKGARFEPTRDVPSVTFTAVARSKQLRPPHLVICDRQAAASPGYEPGARVFVSDSDRTLSEPTKIARLFAFNPLRICRRYQSFRPHTLEQRPFSTTSGRWLTGFTHSLQGLINTVRS